MTTKDITNNIKKIKNIIFAISADAVIIPVKPRIPAIRAMIKNITTHPSMPLPPFKLFPLEDLSFLSKETIIDTKNKMRKIIKITLANPTAEVATPVKPNKPAISAMIKNTIVQPNIFNTLLFINQGI